MRDHPARDLLSNPRVRTPARERRCRKRPAWGRDIPSRTRPVPDRNAASTKAGAGLVQCLSMIALATLVPFSTASPRSTPVRLDSLGSAWIRLACTLHPEVSPSAPRISTKPRTAPLNYAACKFAPVRSTIEKLVARAIMRSILASVSMVSTKAPSDNPHPTIRKSRGPHR